MNPACIVAFLVLMAASCVERTTGYRWPGLDDVPGTFRDLGCGDCCGDGREVPPEHPEPPDVPGDPVEPIVPGDPLDAPITVIR